MGYYNESNMRILGQVSIEDAWRQMNFSMHGWEMKLNQEEFIDENAKLVVNLDV